MRATWFIGKFELLLNCTKHPNYSPKSRTPQQPQNVGGNFEKPNIRKNLTNLKNKKNDKKNHITDFNIVCSHSI
jgi:hypothetical protein